MIKQNIIILLIAAFIAVVGEIGQAEAADFYIGEYGNGDAAYLETDSIRDYQVTRNGYWVCDEYECQIKAVKPNSDKFNRIFYKVTYSEGLIEFMVSKNGQNLYDKHTMTDFLKNHPVERNLVEYFRSLRRSQGK